MEFKFFHGKEIDETEDVGILWTNRNGRNIPIRWLSSRHIHNIINCINGVGELTIPNPYMGRNHSEWLRIFNSELILRDVGNH